MMVVGAAAQTQHAAYFAEAAFSTVVVAQSTEKQPAKQTQAAAIVSSVMVPVMATVMAPVMATVMAVMVMMVMIFFNVHYLRLRGCVVDWRRCIVDLRGRRELLILVSISVGLLPLVGCVTWVSVHLSIIINIL